MTHTKLPTDVEVWRAILKHHGEALGVFSSFTSTMTGEMMTEYSLPGADAPLMGARTTWEPKNREATERSWYWLCCPVNDGE